MTKRDGLPLIGDLGGAMRRNPVSTALIGMGLLWLFTGDRAKAGAGRIVRSAGLDHVPDVASDALDRVGERFADVGDRLSEVRDSAASAAAETVRAARDRSADVIDRATEFGRAIPETGADLFDSAKLKLGDLFEEQPLLLGAIGVAIGAGIAASLPATDTERELFGDTSDEMMAQARDYARQQAARAGEMARDVAGAAAEEARRQGLTPEAAVAAAREVGEKAKRVAEAAEDNVRLE
ncbi:hypothetical protein DNX69_22175 [Rhodopseudomonas palustris]|uniref:DUF3618 domain-containing protein n=1 Tax=Rhodopseudomonas palustris TaxID=1076 RepID=A0A323UQV7_RHOPL|nr:hypothetical protein [Rhodopseudomonas palustris]PZA10038.1 hypothetical protein DNX69_22175 [Rhodopseudomonas palustris]